MFSLSFAVLFIFICATPSESTNSNYTINNQTVLVPDNSLPLNVVKPEKRGKDSFIAERDVIFYLYTRLNQNTPQNLTINYDVIKNSYFNIDKGTRFVIHGFSNNVDSEINFITRRALLQAEDVNVIYVDWGKGAKNSNYLEARSYIGKVGLLIANFINFIAEENKFTNITDNIWMVGHSLGAHTAAIAAKNIKNKIEAVFGLDPAGPLFWDDRPQDRMNSDDADHVFAIHTNTALLGYRNPLAKADIYPNGGAYQPGCGLDIYGACSHGRSVQLFAEMITSNFSMRKCKDERQARVQRCEGEEVKFHRQSITEIENGIYHFKTNDKSPFVS